MHDASDIKSDNCLCIYMYLYHTIPQTSRHTDKKAQITKIPCWISIEFGAHMCPQAHLFVVSDVHEKQLSQSVIVHGSVPAAVCWCNLSVSAEVYLHQS